MIIPGLPQSRWGAWPLRGSSVIVSNSTLHALTFYNTEESPSTGLVRFGVAFEDQDVPSSAIPQLRLAGGADVRSAPIEINRWPSGSLRKCTMVADIGEVSTSTAVEVYARIGAAAVSSLVPATYITGRSDDELVEIRNHTGSSNNTDVGNLDFSLKTALATSTRRETQEDTDLFVRYFVWQQVGADVHLICLNYVDIWLDTDGSTPLAIEWSPVLAQHWFVDDPFGSPMTKQKRTYDATVKIGSTTVDTRTSLEHAYYCRWASLRAEDDAQHARKHWIQETTAMPTLRAEYSDTSWARMARAGYIPPLKRSVTYSHSLGDTYAPLGTNNHEIGINNTGAHQTRGAVDNPSSIAIVSQSENDWRIARVSAQSQLGYYFHICDHRNIDNGPGLSYIPFPFYQVDAGDRAYAGDSLGSEVVAVLGSTEGSDYTYLSPDAAVGGTGTFNSYDNAHHPMNGYAMAFIEGERYLMDSSVSAALYPLHSGNWNGGGIRGGVLYYAFNAPRRTALSIPLEYWGSVPAISSQEREGAWTIRAINQAFNLLPDADIHYQYIRNIFSNLSGFLSRSVSFYPSDHLAYGGPYPRPNVGSSTQWQSDFCGITSYMAALVADAFGMTGYKEWAELAAKRNRLFLENAPLQFLYYQDTRAKAEGWLNFYDVPLSNVDEDDNTASSSNLITLTLGPKLFFAEDSEVYFLKNDSGVGILTAPNTPPEVTIDQKYFATNVTQINDTTVTFNISETLGGSTVTISDTSDIYIGFFSTNAYADTFDGYNPNADSYPAIAMSMMELTEAFGHADVKADPDDVSNARTLFSEISFSSSSYAAWNLDAALVE